LKRGHVPLRTCRGCLRRFPRDVLLRFTLGDAGLVAGSGPGRGYYICRNEACAARALDRRALSRLLGRPMSEGEAEALRRGLLEQFRGSGDLPGSSGSRERR
jgi:predicted RNA-binding protein YlxR (DUF448 family)